MILSRLSASCLRRLSGSTIPRAVMRITTRTSTTTPITTTTTISPTIFSVQTGRSKRSPLSGSLLQLHNKHGYHVLVQKRSPLHLPYPLQHQSHTNPLKIATSTRTKTSSNSYSAQPQGCLTCARNTCRTQTTSCAHVTRPRGPTTTTTVK